jgi:hypothetical protein
MKQRFVTEIPPDSRGQAVIDRAGATEAATEELCQSEVSPKS